MAIGDIPKFPGEYEARGINLIRKLETDELSLDDFKKNMALVLGRITIGEEGIRITGAFGAFVIDGKAFNGIIAAIHELINFLPRFNGRTFFLKKGDHITKWTIGLPPKHTVATFSDFRNSDFPMVELPHEKSEPERKQAGINRLKTYFQGMNTAGGNGGDRLKIHRIEELAEWLGDEWQGVVEFMDIILPLLDLTTKSTLDKLGESYPSFWNDVFTRCGV